MGGREYSEEPKAPEGGFDFSPPGVAEAKEKSLYNQRIARQREWRAKLHRRLWWAGVIVGFILAVALAVFCAEMAAYFVTGRMTLDYLP